MSSIALAPAWVVRERARPGVFFCLRARAPAKTALVTFRQRSDAAFVLRSLEEFYAKHDRFPCTEIDLGMLRAAPPRQRGGAALVAERIATLHEAVEACRGAHMDVCTCKEVRRCEGGRFEFVGTYIDLPADPEASRAALSALFYAGA